MAELHPQKENYLYSEVYNDSIKVTTINKDSTDVKYVDTDSGLCTRTTGHFDSSESHVVFDKGSYYLGVYHENFGIIEEDGADIEIEAISYRTNGINAQFNESYCIAAYVGSEQLTSATFPGSSTSITIPRNTSNSSRNIYITTKQVYSNLICGQGVDQGGVVEQHGAWDYIVTYTFVNTSTIKDTVTPNGNVDNTKYPNIPATTQIKFQLEQSREGGGYSPTTHCIYQYLDYYNTQPNPEWSNQLGNGNYWNITVGSGTQQTGTAQIISVEFEQGTDVHSRQERNPQYHQGTPETNPTYDQYYITVTYTRKCWFVDHCIVTVKGNSTKYGNYTGNTIDTLSTTTVDINGNWTGQPNYSLPGNWSGTAHLKVKDNHPIVDYKLELTKEPNNGTGSDTTVLCINNKRGAQYKSTLQCTVKLSQCTSIGYVGMPQNQLTWTAWEEANTNSSNFTWSSNKTNVATIDTNGKVTVQYANWAANDTNVTITVSLNNSTLNKQGIAYNTVPGGLKSTLTKTTDNKTYIVLGRLDEYVWRIYGLTPTPSNKYIYDKDDSISGHAPKQVSYTIKLQYQKNGNIGTTAWTDYSTQVSKFKWTGDTVAIPTSETSGIYNGINKNYYDGKKSEVTSHYISGNIKAKANFIDNNDVKFTDNKHVVYGTSEYHVIDSKTVVNALEVTDTIYVYGYMTYYTVSVIMSGSSTAAICCNSSRSHYNPTPSGIATFSVILSTSHRSGTTTNYSITSGPNLPWASGMVNWSSSPSASNYYTLTVSSGAFGCTCHSPHTRFSENDKTFTVTASIASLAEYNIDNISVGSVSYTLYVLGREDEYTCGSISFSISGSTTMNDGDSRSASVSSVTYKKNNSNVSLLLSEGTYTWSISQSSDNDAYRTVTVSPTSGSSTTILGTNNYYQYTKGTYAAAVICQYSFTKQFTPRFSDNSTITLTCSGSASQTVYVSSHANEYNYINLSCSLSPTVIEWNGSSTISVKCTQQIKNGRTGSWSWTNYNTNYSVSGFDAVASSNDIHVSGSTITGIYSSLTSTGYATGIVYVNWNGMNTSCSLAVKPRPDEWSTDYNFVQFYSSLPSGGSDYASFNGYVYKNGSTYLSFDTMDASWSFSGSGLADWGYDHSSCDVYADELSINAPDEYIYWSVSFSWGGSFDDRNKNINGITHTPSINYSNSGTITVVSDKEAYIRFIAGNVSFPSNCLDWAYEWDVDELGSGYDSGPGSPYGGTWGDNDTITVTPGYHRIDWVFKYEWEDQNGINDQDSIRDYMSFYLSAGATQTIDLPDYSIY